MAPLIYFIEENPAYIDSVQPFFREHGKWRLYGCYFSHYASGSAGSTFTNAA